MTQDHYAILGVTPTAQPAAIRAAYLALMREYHPDRNSNPAATLRAQAIIAAFKVLGDFDQRSYYDWDRRRERERAAAAARPDRTLDKKAAAVGAVGAALVVAAMAAWSGITPPPDSPFEAATYHREPQPADVAEPAADPLPSVQPDKARTPSPVAERGETIIRMRPALPPRAKPVVARRVEPAKPARPIAARRDAPHPIVRVAERDIAERVMKPTLERGAPPPVRAATKPSSPKLLPAQPTTDLASLDQFVMSFYGQSWRYGDPRKRASLEQSRNAFVVRRAGCAADSCKRAAYLKLMRDVSDIVESGETKPR